MKCPYCGHENTRVIDSRPAEDNNSIRRRRVCDECDKRFTTYEKVETIPLIIIKKDENREPYDRSKIEAGVLRACHKRPVSINQINEFSPDVAIFMLNCTHRDDVDTDVNFLKKLAKSYAEVNSMRLPIVVVVNKCDEMAPTRFKNPKDYPQNKISKINEVVQYYKGIIVRNGLKIDNIIAVSSLIDWMTSDGMEIDAESIDNLPTYDIENLQIAFDGRYQIDKLLDKNFAEVHFTNGTSTFVFRIELEIYLAELKKKYESEKDDG